MDSGYCRGESIYFLGLYCLYNCLFIKRFIGKGEN